MKKEVKCSFCASKKVESLSAPDIYRCQKCGRLFVADTYDNRMQDRTKRERKARWTFNLENL